MAQWKAEHYIDLKLSKEEDAQCALARRQEHHRGAELCGRCIQMNPGDLIWQSRMPGGVCIYMGEVTKETTQRNPDLWTEIDEPVYLIFHPTEGVIEDPSYYYMTLEEQESYHKRRVAYELRKAGREVPEWLQKEIDNESG